MLIVFDDSSYGPVHMHVIKGIGSPEIMSASSLSSDGTQADMHCQRCSPCLRLASQQQPPQE